MDSSAVNMSELASKSDNEDIRTQLQDEIPTENNSSTVSKGASVSAKEKKPAVGWSDVVAVVALVLAVLSLILILILITNNLKQQPGTQDQPANCAMQVDQCMKSQAKDTQTLQAQINSLMSSQSHVNSSIAIIQSQLIGSFQNFRTEVNKSNQNVLTRAQQQQEIIAQELDLLKLYRNATTKEIDDLKSSLFVEIKKYENEIQKISNHISTSVDAELLAIKENIVMHTNQLKTLINKLQSINSTIQDLDIFPFDNRSQIGTFGKPANSCKDIPQGSPSGRYWIKRDSLPFEVYCDTNRRNCSCDSSSEAWMRVANIDMTDRTQWCPYQFELITRTQTPFRTCGRGSGIQGCISTSFPVYGIEYSRVCGRIVGYQIGSPSGFGTGSSSINSHYIAGISLTHGTSRQHIWSLVNAQGEGYSSEVCPCIGGTDSIPSFVGSDYFCDSAVRGSNAVNGRFYPEDPLWDGQGCGRTSTCCEFNNPPWFCKQLPQPTTDNIELRLCENSDSIYDDTPLEIVEIYIS